MQKRLLILLILVLLLSSVGTHAQVYIQQEISALEGSVTISADILNLGQEQLVVATGSTISVYLDLDGEPISVIQGFNGAVTALAVGDLTGNFRPELVVGTDNAGAFYIFEFINGQWRAYGRPRYLWAPISYLQVADVNGDGWGDLIAVNANGEAQVYVSWQGELYNFWRSQPNQRIRFVKAADLTGDGSDEIVYTHAVGHVGILKWDDSQLSLVWENYPWGSIEGLVVTQLPGGKGPEVMVVTGQKMFYSWLWDGRQFVLNRHYHEPQLGDGISYISGEGLVSVSRERGLSMFSVGATRLNERWNVAHAQGTRVIRHQGKYLVQASSGTYFWLNPVDTNYLQVIVDGQSLEQPVDFIIDGNSLLLNIYDIAKVLDLSVTGNNRILVSNGINHGIIYPGEAAMIRGDLRLPLSEPVRLVNNGVYVPIDLLSLFKWELNYDPTRRRLEILPLWGWWIGELLASEINQV